MDMTSPVPHRQIRALYDDTHITLYQAYPPAIASAALLTQRLDASPDFLPSRMTWLKPSWSWMLYRSGYSLKEPRQSRILALKVRRADWDALLAEAVSTSSTGRSSSHAPRPKSSRGGESVVRVQWDPERTPRLERLPYRSIQVGLSARRAAEMVVSVEDVTQRARELKRVLEEGEGGGRVSGEEFERRGLVPREVPYPVADAVVSRLEMSDA